MRSKYFTTFATNSVYSFGKTLRLVAETTLPSQHSSNLSRKRLSTTLSALDTTPRLSYMPATMRTINSRSLRTWTMTPMTRTQRIGSREHSQLDIFTRRFWRMSQQNTPQMYITVTVLLLAGKGLATQLPQTLRTATCISGTVSHCSTFFKKGTDINPVWHQQQLKYQDFDKLAGRFVSEFGMEGFPHIKTIDSYLPKDSPERYAQSSTIDFHNKADGHERRIALYLVENFRYSFTPLESYIYFTQLMQAECLSTAYNLWRRNWKGEGREYTAGALVWQINDCWPVTSWAIVDYYLRPKPAYYTIRRELHPLIVSAKRREEKIPKNPHTRVDIETRNLLEIWSSNLATSEVTDLTLHVTAFHAQTGKELKSHSLKTFTQPENATTELVTLNIADYTTEEYPDHTQIVFGIYLKNSSGEIVARRVDWSQPLKYVHTFPKTEDINISVEGNVVKASAKVPVKGLVFESDEGHFEDQMVDLVPGETVEVKVRGLKGNVKGRWYGMDL